MLAREAGDPLGGPMYYDGELNIFRRLHGGNIYQTRVTMATQRASQSDILASNRITTLPIIRNVMALMRKMKNVIKK